MKDAEVRALFADIVGEIVGFDPWVISESDPDTTLGNFGLVIDEYPALGTAIRTKFGIELPPTPGWMGMTVPQAVSLIQEKQREANTGR